MGKEYSLVLKYPEGNNDFILKSKTSTTMLYEQYLVLWKIKYAVMYRNSSTDNPSVFEVSYETKERAWLQGCRRFK